MELVIKTFIIFAALIGLVALPVAAEAKGCIKGAIVGGVPVTSRAMASSVLLPDALSDITKQVDTGSK
jgi:hypothetical protein